MIRQEDGDAAAVRGARLLAEADPLRAARVLFQGLKIQPPGGRAACDIETALRQYLKAWQAATDASAAAVALVAPSDPINDYHLLLEGPLSRRVEAELARIGYVNSSIGPAAWLPGVRLGAAAEPHKTRPLAEEIREVDNLYVAKFERTLGLSEPLPEPEPVERQSYTGWHPGTDLWYEAREKHLREAAAADDKPGIGRVLAYTPPDPTMAETAVEAAEAVDNQSIAVADDSISEATPPPLEAVDDHGIVVADPDDDSVSEAAALPLEDDQDTVIADTDDDTLQDAPAPSVDDLELA